MSTHSDLRAAGGLAAARLGARVLGLFTGVLVSRLLGPERLGLLALPNLVLSMAPLLTLGFADALVRMLPLAKTDPEQHRALRETSLSLGSLLGLVLLLVAFGQWALLRSFPSSDFLLVVLALLCGFGNYLFKFFYCDLSGTHQFRILAKAQFIQGLIRTAFVLSFLFLLPDPWRIYALYLGMLISFSAMDGWLLLRWLRGLRLRMHSGVSPQLFQQGIAISFVALTNTMLVSADRLVVSHLFEARTLGLFEQSVLLREALLLMPGVLMTVFIPGYSRKVAEKQPADEMARVTMRQNLLLSVLILPLLGLATINLPWGLELLLPDYTQATLLYQRTCLAVIPLLLAFLPLALVVSVGRPWRVALAGLLSIGGVLILDGLRLTQTASLSALHHQMFGWSVYAGALFFFVMQMQARWRVNLNWFVATLLVVGWLVVDLYFSEFLALKCVTSGSVLYYVLKNVLLLLGYLPVFYLYARLSGRAVIVGNMLRSLLRRETDNDSKEA